MDKCETIYVNKNQNVGRKIRWHIKKCSSGIF